MALINSTSRRWLASAAGLAAAGGLAIFAIHESDQTGGRLLAGLCIATAIGLCTAAGIGLALAAAAHPSRAKAVGRILLMLLDLLAGAPW